jgi:hypothetical protein
MSRRVKMLAPVLVFAVAVPTAAVASTSEPDRPPGSGLDVGSWIADGFLEGVSTQAEEGVDFEFTARFDYQFEFDVDTAGAASGGWTFTGNGTLLATSPDGDVVFEQAYTGGGELFTIGDEIAYGGTLTRTGVARSAGFETPINETETAETLAIDITGSSCEEAWGDLAPSYIANADDLWATADWVGPWFAVRQDTERDDRPDLVPGLNQIAADHTRLLAGLSATDVSTEIVPALWGLIHRALPILNEIRNLGECARRLFDDDQLEWWETIVSTFVRDSILAILTATDVDGFELLALVDAGLAANAFGPNLPTPVLTDDALAALRARTDEIIGEMVIEDGDPLPEGGTCDNARGCLGVTSWDQLGALVAAKKMGWDVELADGSRRSAESLIQQWAEQGGDVEGAVADNRPGGGEDG